MVDSSNPSTPPVQANWTVPLPTEAGSELSSEGEALPAEPALETASDSPAEPLPEPVPVTPAIPEVAATLQAPASPTEPGAGGEWALLVAKVQDWIGSGALQDSFQRYRSPLQLFGVLLGAVLVLRLVGAVLGAIEGLPLVPGLFELAGVVWLANFSATRLVRAQERRRLLEALQKRWQAFRGQV